MVSVGPCWHGSHDIAMGLKHFKNNFYIRTLIESFLVMAYVVCVYSTCKFCFYRFCTFAPSAKRVVLVLLFMLAYLGY